jgi:hypothetical protein
VIRERLSDYKTVLERVAAMLAAAPTKRIVWRTTDEAEQYMPYKSPEGIIPPLAYPGRYHFLNEPRRLKFGLEAVAVMRRHGLRVLNTRGLPTDFSDVVHYNPVGFDLQNRLFSWVIC